jgi:nicotinamide-nucleotide amidase
MITPDDLEKRAAALLVDLHDAGLMVATAESCTGGLVAGVLTEIAGSSAVFERGFVTYSNEAKTEILAVPRDLIESHGAVSEEVAKSMAIGAIAASRADLAVSITGIAGPGGGSTDKPVGLVHFGAMRRGAKIIHREMRFGEIGRHQVRLESVGVALGLLGEIASASG